MSIGDFSPMCNRVAVDVYPWALACEQRGGYAIEGIYRHTELAIRRGCTPVIVNTVGEKFPEAGHRFLSTALGKEVTVITSRSFEKAAEFIAFAGYRAWLSPAMDFLCPAVEFLPPYVSRHVIVHDVMAYHGTFGERNGENFRKSLSLFDAYYPVSKHTQSELESILDAHPRESTTPMRIIEGYRGFLPLSFYETYRRVDEARDPHFALSVGSVFRRKQTERLPFALAKAVNKLGVPVHHVGRFLDPNSQYRNIVRHSPGIEFHEDISDAELRDMYAKATYFLCISKEEGFSIPPLEALASGVPIVVLSDIPVHRELYDKYTGVIFLDPETLSLSSRASDFAHLGSNTKQQALSVQHDWHPLKTTMPLYRELAFCIET